MEWLYSGASALINKDDYLLGKPVDKNFELLQSGGLDLEAASSSSVAPLLDRETKIREDPLFAIKKREEEQRKQWLSNPIKMKQIQKMLEQKQQEKEEKKKKKKQKKHKKKVKHRKADDGEGSIAGRSYEDKKRKKVSHSHSSDPEFMGMDVNKLKQYLLQDGLGVHSSSSSDEATAVAPGNRSKHAKRAQGKSKHTDTDSSSEESHSNKQIKNRHERNSDKTKLKSHRRDDERESARYLRNTLKRSLSSPSEKRSATRTAESKSDNAALQKPVRKKLSADEMEKRREEMEMNAKWRDETRKESVDKYNKEEARELESQFKRKADFIAPMVSHATGKGSVEDRIKRNIYKVRQSGRSLESNFAKK